MKSEILRGLGYMQAPNQEEKVPLDRRETFCYGLVNDEEQFTFAADEAGNVWLRAGIHDLSPHGFRQVRREELTAQ